MDWPFFLKPMLRALSLLLLSGLLIKLLGQKLAVRYPAFFSLLAAHLAASLSLGYLIPYRSNLYAIVYFGVEVAFWILESWVILEIYHITFRGRPGIQTIGRRVLLGALFFGIAASLAFLLVESSAARTHYPWLDALSLVARTVTGILLVFQLTLNAFLAWMPIPLSRNCLVHTTVLSVYLLTETSLHFLRNIFGLSHLEALNVATHAATCLCLVAWIALLRPSGEEVRARGGLGLAKDTESRVLAHMDALNAALQRSARS